MPVEIHATAHTPVSRREFLFYRENAGYVVGRRAEGAIHMARAAAEAERRGWTFTWEYDPDPWSVIEDMDESLQYRTRTTRDGQIVKEPIEYTVEGCVLRDERGNVLASLWGILDADPVYRRIVEAELACEAIGNIGPIQPAPVWNARNLLTAVETSGPFGF